MRPSGDTRNEFLKKKKNGNIAFNRFSTLTSTSYCVVMTTKSDQDHREGDLDSFLPL